MRSRQEGWRSARSAQRTRQVAAPSEPASLPTSLPAPPGATAAGARSGAAAPAVSTPRAGWAIAAGYDWPWRGVTWSLTYVAFLVYIFVITTYRVPIGDVSMAVALFGLFFLPRVRVPGVLIWMGAFLVWSAVGAFQSPYQATVQKELFAFAKLWFVALVAVNALNTKANIRFYAVVFLGCFALFPMRGAFVNYFGGYTVVGRALWNYIYANPNDLAALTLIQLSLAVSLIPTERHRITRWCVLLGVALLPILVLMTQSRGAFLALALFVALYVGGQRKRGRAIAVVAAIGLAVVLISPRGVWERVRGLAKIGDSPAALSQVDREGSARQRYEIWRVARAIIADHPAFGVGFGAYPRAHRIYAESGPFNRTARGGRDTHSTYLNVTAETGFIGAFFFMGMVLSALLVAERARRRWKGVFPDAAQALYALELGLVAYLVAGLFGSFAKLSFLYLHLVLLVAMAHWLNGAAPAALAAGTAPAAPRPGTPSRALVRRRGRGAVA